MKFSLSAMVLAVATLASAGPTLSYSSGFNLGATHKSGSCKTTAQWKQELTKLKSWSTGSRAKFDTVKIFSTSDCNALANIVPAAIEAGVLVWVCVWNVPEAKFTIEKSALEAALKKYPDTSKWLKGINVGSESLYRKEITASRLAEQIYDVKGMVQSAYKSPNVPIGTADTWTMWVDQIANGAVTTASDVVIMNGFPYWQGATPAQALDKLKDAIWNTRKEVGYEKPFLIGETGWPTAGDNFGAAVPSVENAQAYWKAAACWLQSSPSNYPWYWFSAWDEPNKAAGVERSFGVGTASQPLKFSLQC